MKSLPLQVVKSFFGDYCSLFFSAIFGQGKEMLVKIFIYIKIRELFAVFFFTGLKCLCVKAGLYAN